MNFNSIPFRSMAVLAIISKIGRAIPNISAQLDAVTTSWRRVIHSGVPCSGIASCSFSQVRRVAKSLLSLTAGNGKLTTCKRGSSSRLAADCFVTSFSDICGFLRFLTSKDPLFTI